MTSTGEMIAWFLDNNDLTINQLAEASGVTPKTVYRVINEGAKLSNKIALGLHNLLPGIKIEDIVAYDAKFQFEKQQYEQINNFFENGKREEYCQVEGSAWCVRRGAQVNPYCD